MARTYSIIEHHYDVSRPGWKHWTVAAGVTTNIARAVIVLADRRRRGELPATLAHWAIGPRQKVQAQSALELYRRQVKEE